MRIALRTDLRYRRVPGPGAPRAHVREVTVALSVEIVGQAAKRGLIPRQPTADRLLADIETWLRSADAEFIRTVHRRPAPDGRSELAIAVHPAAADAMVRVGETGRVAFSAVTSPVGPGYHTYLCQLVERLGAEQDIAWAPVGAPDGSRDDTGAFGAGEAGGRRVAAERAHLAWLGQTLLAIRGARRKGARGIHLGTPAGVRFTFEGALATALGPRDDEWLEQALADPRVAVDIVPWWADAADGRHLLNRALSLMWTEVRWRAPGLEGERELLEDVVRLLWRAYPLDPALPYPWREWQEVLVLRGANDPSSRMVAERSARPTDDRRPPIGYRRDPVTIVQAGWALPVPGSFGERRDPEEWWGGEGGRSVTLAGTETGTPRGPMTPDDFLDQVSGDLGMHALEHRAGGLKSRARLGTDGSSGVDIGVLDAYAAVTGRGAALRITFDDPADYQWALDTWRSLAPA